MSEQPDIAKILAGAVYCVAVVVGSYSYHSWQAARQAEAALSAEDRTKRAYVADLAASVKKKLKATDASAADLTVDETLFNSCLLVSKADERAAPGCFWTEKDRIAIATKERQAREFAAEKEKVAALAAAASAEKVREQYEAETRAEQQARGSALPTSATATIPRDGQSPARVEVPHVEPRPSLPHLVSVPRARPTGPVVPSRMTRNGAFIPSRQLDY
jgi:hypothetical protein